MKELPSDFLSGLRRHAVPWGLGGLAFGAGVYGVVGVKPWQTEVAAAVAAKKVPPVWDSMLWGWWYAAWGVLVMALGLLVLRRWWSGAPSPLVKVPRMEERPVSRWVWWGALGVLLVVTAWHRWPRMSHSLWGDESMAVAEYVQGHYILTDESQPLGSLRFRKVTWKETVFGDRQMGNNHYLFTQLARVTNDRWRSWTGGAKHEFSEVAIRVPSLLGGLGLLVALAWLGRRLGAPRAGLLAAVLMALHPWHLRYCTEARGYSLMGMFLCLTLGLLIGALEVGTWSAWALFATAQFCTLYSCKIAVYPLVLINGVVAMALWRAGGGRPLERLQGLGRWFVVNTVSAMVFLILYAPCHAQAVAAVEKIRKRGLNDVSWDWLRDMTSETLTGIPWTTLTPDNPVQITWSKLMHAGGVPVWSGALGFLLMALAIALGATRMWCRCRPAAWVLTACLGAAVVSIIHFHDVLKVELLPWYWFFLTPPLCLTAALGVCLVPGWVRPAAGLALIGFFGWATLPLQRTMIRVPYEDFRSAVTASRGRHEDRIRRTSSRVHTCWFWRSSQLYDPRRDTKVRTLPMLNQRIRAAQRAQAELYVIIGYPWLTARLTPTVFDRVTTSPSFEKMAEFPAQVPRHTLTVYRYVPGRALEAAAPDQMPADEVTGEAGEAEAKEPEPADGDP